MANKWLTSTLLATAVAAGSYYLGKEENREKLMHEFNRLKAKLKGESKEDYEPYLEEKIGHSDPNDIEDNSMVDEGAVFSVNYYNEKHKK
ncbi:hypothetical protein HXA34_13810 [Salipaludibacillus agaradhaerens]|jgi:hypothetical protein|uniref:YbyB n=1 Tax=Salipaludibacillus agaradhaerens TaxID=76935 RepID=A0A9Q4FYH3_SALAG|nr:hypothetical protein [Salipaludibacillus agaradhaerens]UJW58435.1 hypothetical protein HXZ66_13945 [Bacillus sp. A116_S68]MCR6095733.1 hypothetical protein [Salipaludibacillus agaradhaerens]MCR6107377.1 hypothetical protein [Salipaludibacillus agaradhaerens]MCR6114707.1 hypothetical protein [Salipaludibacillus agaradhaerens]MCR6119406.1 hypothetical protein [Salipaludibacillus agaradhaerens]